MNIQEIADEVATASDQVINAGFRLTDEGRRLQDIAGYLRDESWEATDLGPVINELRALARQIEREIDDAAAIIARCPYSTATYT